jgi:hypothetical protein
MLYRVSLRGMSVVLGLFCTLALAGCGSGVIPPSLTSGSSGGSSSSGGSGSSSGSSGSSGSGSSGPQLTGIVQGGQQAISGSNVYMYAAGTSGYGSGATSLLSGNGYVTTDSTGDFSIAGNFTCPSATSQIYLIAEGGSAGSGNNSDAVLMVALGNCSGLADYTNIDINEVTTVAAVYSLSQFMTPGSTAVGTSSSNITGLVNAFQTAANLVDVTTGAARTLTPGGNGSVPATTINALANILASCVDSTTSSSSCSSLFSAATPPSGSAPADTLASMLDIALNPGNNISKLYGLISATGTFQPTLAGVPNDWTLSVEYTGGGLNYGQLLAIDAAGDVWVPNSIDPGTISEFGPNGDVLSGQSGYTGGGLSYPYAIAIDTNGDAWAANSGNDTVSEHSSNGTALSGSGYTAQGLQKPYAIAIDGSGNVFTANGNNSVTKLNSSGSTVAQFVNGGLDFPFGIAIDSSENVWVANYGASNSVSEFSNTGTPASPTAFTGGGINGAVGVAIDSKNDAWIANFSASTVSELSSSGTPLSGMGYATPAVVSDVAIDGNNTLWTANGDGSISHLAANGAAISPVTGYVSAGATGEVGIAIDASGNVWTTDAYVNSIFEYVGAASPAAVPLQAAVKNKTIGQRP